jgi:hypothetical protein
MSVNVTRDAVNLREELNALRNQGLFYEEGEFTPVASDTNNLATGNDASTNSAFGFYVKVGTLVTVSIGLINITTTGMIAGNIFYVLGLPFLTSGDSFKCLSVGAVRADRITHDGATITVETNGVNANWCMFKHSISNAVDEDVLVSDFSSGNADIFFTLSYRTDS